MTEVRKRLWRRYRHVRRVGLNSMAAVKANVGHGFPAKGMRLVGITGTDGKTTTASMVAAILRADGRKVGLVSTLGAEIDGQFVETGLHESTPGPAAIYALLAQMRDQGVTDVVMEVTSHALDQRRVFGLHFDVAVVTNITPEHLDYHETFAKYVAAKSRLVRLAEVAVLNKEDRSTGKLARLAKRVVYFAVDETADIQAEHIKLTGNGSEFLLDIGKRQIPVPLELPGRYNIGNALAAAGVAAEFGVPAEVIARGLMAVKDLSGRWEIIQKQPFAVIVDFAHTPHAFAEVLPAARKLVGRGGRLIQVFGCAGSRDKEKRQEMGRLSGQLADISVLTIEDPRTEPVDRIQSMVVAGFEQAKKKEFDASTAVNCGWIRIDDRQQAIDWAVGQARDGDVVIVTGKGHEKSLAIGTKEVPWSDQEAVRVALSRR